jgi:hypothetical protein
LRKFRFAAVALALQVSFATKLNAADLSQSYQITTHRTSDFVCMNETPNCVIELV